jgi:hypothetical protein
MSDLILLKLWNKNIKELENVNKRNIVKIDKFTEDILNKPNKKQKKYISYIESNSLYGIITAPTQVGKTDATRKMIEKCLINNIPVIISSDNKSDQQDQLFNRIKNNLTTNDNILIKVSDNKYAIDIENCINENKTFVLFCLDNPSQIEKINKIISYSIANNNNFKKYKKIMIIHDEGDIIQKDSDILTHNIDQAKSHQNWIKLSKLINEKTNVNLKKVFVTATLENCCALYDIETADVMELEIPNNYQGYKNINYTELDDLDIIEILKSQINRIKNNSNNKTGEIILYCVEKNIKIGKKSQHNILHSLSITKKIKNVTINTYNGESMIVHTKNDDLKKLLKNIKIKTNKNKIITCESQEKIINDNVFIEIDKRIPIRKFYSLCKKANERVVITIGKDLINRGISFVSEKEENDLYPLCATTLICNPGKKANVVYINQLCGRITGLARPDLQRFLFAPKKIISDYKNYNKNQEDFLKKIRNNKLEITKNLWLNHIHDNKLYNNIDRPKLNIEMNYKKEIEEEIKGEIDKVKLKSLNKWLKANDLLVSRMIKFLYECKEEISYKKFKNGINYDGTDEDFQSNLRSGNKGDKGYLWKYKTEQYKIINIKMNPKIREYIDNSEYQSI